MPGYAKLWTYPASGRRPVWLTRRQSRKGPITNQAPRAKRAPTARPLPATRRNASSARHWNASAPKRPALLTRAGARKPGRSTAFTARPGTGARSAVRAAAEPAARAGIQARPELPAPCTSAPAAAGGSETPIRADARDVQRQAGQGQEQQAGGSEDRVAG